jgi:alpha-beta hydrolase superfamily lysophospholipase
MSAYSSPVGCSGRLTVATRGAQGPGEVLVSIRGGTETFLAWSEQPLAAGTEVLVFDARGHRAVDVMEWPDHPADPDRAPAP